MKKLKHIYGWSAFDEGYEVFTNKSGEKYWGDVGAGVLPIAADTGRVLVAHRSKYVNEPNTWGVFGGQIDDPSKESPAEAAKRELKEESGKDNLVKLIPAYVFTSQDGGFKYHNFIGIVQSEFAPVLDWETQDAKWMTIDELERLEPKHFGLKEFLDKSIDEIKKYTR